MEEAFEVGFDGDGPQELDEPQQLAVLLPSVEGLNLIEYLVIEHSGHWIILSLTQPYVHEDGLLQVPPQQPQVLQEIAFVQHCAMLAI